jgi:hypothetical protein
LGAAALSLAGCGSEQSDQALEPAERGDETSVEPRSEEPTDNEGTEPDCPIDESYNPPFDPGRFVARVDNSLFPLVPETKYTYREGETQTNEISVLSETKTIAGVVATVVHDVASEDGEVIEDTFDYYAQDASGAVWYLGEDTKALSDGVVSSTEGSWLTGVDGAKSGYIIPPTLSVGLNFRQEYLACAAEDQAVVLELDTAVAVPAGSFTGCMKTRNTTRLEPTVVEEKYYCPGTGLVLAVDLGTGERFELLSITK